MCKRVSERDGEQTIETNIDGVFRRALPFACVWLMLSDCLPCSRERVHMGTGSARLSEDDGY